MNASGQPIRPGTDPNEIVALLKRPGTISDLSKSRPGLKASSDVSDVSDVSSRQLTNPVLWEDSMKAVIREGVKEF